MTLLVTDIMDTVMRVVNLGIPTRCATNVCQIRHMIESKRKYFSAIFYGGFRTLFVKRQVLEKSFFTSYILLIYMSIDFQTVLLGIMDIGVNIFVQKIVGTMQIVIPLMEHVGMVVKQDS